MLRSLTAKLGRFDPKRRFFPRHKITEPGQFNALVDQMVLDCFEPPAPFITKETPLVTMGSCFANNVSKNLTASGYNVFLLGVSDRLFSPVALKVFIERALRDQAPMEELCQHWTLDPDQVNKMRAFVQAGATVIITLGMSRIWVDKQTGEYILDPTVKFIQKDGMPQLRFPDSNRYETRQMPIEEITDCIMSIISALRTINYNTKIILTLSPIPLAYSGSDYPVMAADCVSKSGLRFAIDEIGKVNFKDVYYFPSFEILRWLAPLAAHIWFADRRSDHIRHDWIAYTVGKFRELYCVGGTGSPVPPLHVAAD